MADVTPVAVGVDGCRSGWVAALFVRGVSEEPKTSLRHFKAISELASWRDSLDDEVFVTIDVPISLPEETRFRRCDEEARRHLGKRRNSVFMPPGKYLLAARDYAEARRLVEERKREKPSTKAIGAHGWGIVPKIREVDSFLQADLERQEWLLEVHPEVCFLAWSGRVLPGKKSATGQIERLRLVRKEFPDAEHAIAENDNENKNSADLTDVLDAYAALWTALRRTANKHETLAEEVLDGLRARMLV